ncbi:MAG: alpha-L-fucosidase [Planctomycetota bacterium]
MTEQTDPSVIRKLQWWQELKFGLFIHWGIYSVWGAVESWPIVDKEPYGRDSLEQWDQSGHDTETFMQMYFDQNTLFNPTDFDPEQWAKAAKDAGMKYLVFTTKHHDGFCMYDTQYTDYRVTSPDCPYHSHPDANITKRVFDAFREQGFGIGIYYSKADWHCPDYWDPESPRIASTANYDPTKHPERWKRYIRFVHNQITELLTEYGPVDLLWLDAGWVKVPREDIQMAKIAEIARTAQPGILIVDRDVGGEFENYRTPEQKVPEAPLDEPWETCMTMGGQWSYKPSDHYKSTRELIHLLVDIAAKGGNLLLNIGPDADGNFDNSANNRLSEIAEWMKINKEAIYHTKATHPYKSNNLCVTQKSDLIYVYYLAGKDEEGLPENVKVDFIRKAAKVRLLGNDAAIHHQSDEGYLAISIPQQCRISPPCEYVWVFEIIGAEIIT